MRKCEGHVTGWIALRDNGTVSRNVKYPSLAPIRQQVAGRQDSWTQQSHYIIRHFSRVQRHNHLEVISGICQPTFH